MAKFGTSPAAALLAWAAPQGFGVE